MQICNRLNKLHTKRATNRTREEVRMKCLNAWPPLSVLLLVRPPRELQTTPLTSYRNLAQEQVRFYTQLTGSYRKHLHAQVHKHMLTRGGKNERREKRARGGQRRRRKKEHSNNLGHKCMHTQTHARTRPDTDGSISIV